MLLSYCMYSKVQGWSEKEYSDWMDKHLLEKDRLAFIQQAQESGGNHLILRLLTPTAHKNGQLE